MRVYLWQRDGKVFYYAAETDKEAKANAKQLDGFNTAPDSSATIEEWEAAGSTAYIDSTGTIVLGESPEHQEKNEKEKRRTEIMGSLDSIDVKSVRPARAVATALATDGSPDEKDVQYLNQLEGQANDLRAELAAL